MSVAEGRVLCRLADIPNGEGKGFEVEDSGKIVEIFVVRRGEATYGYHNDCPHAGTPLNWSEDRYMTLDRKYILCATHGAEFRIEDGYCTIGPCAGDRLTPIELELCDGAVVLKRL